MGNNNSKRGSYDLEKSAKKATSEKLKTEKTISLINLTEQEIYEDLFPFRRRSTKRGRNVHDDDPRPYSIAVMEDNCYENSDLPLNSTTSLGSDGENMKPLERRDTRSEPILYNVPNVKENLLEEVPQIPPRGIIKINQNEGYVYSVEDFPQQYQYSLQKRYMDVPAEPIHTFISDSSISEERQYHSIQENSRRNPYEATILPRRASCPELLLDTVGDSYFPNITEYYFQTISQRELQENHKVTGSSSTSSGMSEVDKNHLKQQEFISNFTNNNSLTLKEDELDPCCIYETIKSSDVLQPYEIELINDWLAKAQADCNRKKLSNNFISSPLHNEEDFFTAASDSLPSCTGSRSNKVTFDNTVTKRVYSESSATDEDEGIKRNSAPRRNSDTSSLTSSDAESVKFSLGYRYRDEKGTIYSEDGYKSSEEDSEEDMIKIREQQIKLLMSNSIISAESIEQLRSDYHAKMGEQNDLHVISETEEDEEENFYDALDQERNKELIEFIEQFPSFNGSSDGNYLDKLNVDGKDNDCLDSEVQNSFAKFETLCQTEELRFDVKCEWDESNPKEEVKVKYPMLGKDSDDFSLSSETIVSDNHLLELGGQEEHNPETLTRDGEDQNEGFDYSKSAGGSNQNNGIHFSKHSRIVEKLEPVYQIPYQTEIISKTDEEVQPPEYYASETYSNDENVIFDPLITKEKELEKNKNDSQLQKEEELFSNYEYINSLMKKSKQTEEFTSSNCCNNSKLQENENDDLVSVGEEDNVTDSGQMLQCKQIHVEEINKNVDIIYPIPHETHELEEIVPYSSDNFDFEQSIKYEFIHSQQLIYPVKIKDDHFSNETSGVKYKVTSFDPDLTTDELEILIPFDEKSIGLLPDEVDLQVSTSEGFDITTASNKNTEQFRHLTVESIDENHQYLENVPQRTLRNQISQEDLNSTSDFESEENKPSHRGFTNPFLNDQLTGGHQIEIEKEFIDDDVQQPIAVIAPIPKPRKNLPNSNNPERINDIMESAAATVGSENISNSELSGWILVDDSPKGDRDDDSGSSYVLNSEYFRNKLPLQLESEESVWRNNQTVLDKGQGYEQKENVFLAFKDEKIELPSSDTTKTIHNQEKLTEVKEEPIRGRFEDDFSMISFGDLDFDVKPKGDIWTVDQKNIVSNVFQESRTNKETSLDLFDEPDFLGRQNKSDKREESLPSIKDHKQKEVDLWNIVPNVFREDQKGNEKPLDLFDEPTFGEKQNKSDQPEDLHTTAEKKQKQINQWNIAINKFQDDQRDRHTSPDDPSFLEEQNKSNEQEEDLLTVQDSKQKENFVVENTYLKDFEMETTIVQSINHLNEAPHLRFKHDTLQRGTYFDHLDTKPEELIDQSNITGNASKEVENYKNFGSNFKGIIEIQPDNSLDDLQGENNLKFLDYLKNEVIVDNFDNIEHHPDDNNEENNKDNVNAYSRGECEWSLDESNENLRKPLRAYYEIQNLPTVTNINNTSVIYYEQFQRPIIMGKKDEEKEEKVSYQGNIRGSTEITSDRNHEVDLGNSLILQKVMKDGEGDSEDTHSEIYPVHILKIQDQDPSRLSYDFLQTSQHEAEKNSSDASAVNVKLNFSETAVNNGEGDFINVDSVEDFEQDKRDRYPDQFENFSEPYELFHNEETSPKSDTTREINGTVPISFQDNAPVETFVDVSKPNGKEISEIILKEYFTETKSSQDIRLEVEINDKDVDISNSSFTKISIKEVDIVQEVSDFSNTLSISDTDKTQKHLNRSNPIETLESLNEEEQPLVLRDSYTLTQPVIHQTRSENATIEENKSESFHYPIYNSKERENLLTDQSSTGDRKQDNQEGINKNKDGVVPRKTLSQIFKNRQQHDRPRSVNDLIRRVELKSPSRRARSNPEEKSENPNNSNNNTPDNYLKGLFSKISNTKTINTFERSSADFSHFNRKSPYLSNPDNYNFTKSTTAQTNLDENNIESVGQEDTDYFPERVSIEKNADTFENIRENPILKEESDEELELENILQDLDVISERMKGSTNEIRNYVNMDNLYVELLRRRVAVHKIQNNNLNYNLMTMQREALKKIRSLLKDIERAKIR